MDLPCKCEGLGDFGGTGESYVCDVVDFGEKRSEDQNRIVYIRQL